MTRSAAHHAITFGPFSSPQLGSCLGFNIAPDRRTPETEGSVYDKVAPGEGEPIIGQRRKMPTPGVVITSAARRIIELSKGGEKIKCLVITGNKEPTSHPELIEIIENLRELRNKWYSKASLCLISNALDVEAVHLKHALGMFDIPIVRFEWGTAKSFGAATGRPGTDLKRIVESVSGLEKLVVQATLRAGKSAAETDSEIRNWIKKLDEIRPREVYVGTLESKEAKARGVKPLTAAKLEKVAAELTETTGIAARVVSAEALPV